jgi:hypothetical protein
LRLDSRPDRVVYLVGVRVGPAFAGAMVVTVTACGGASGGASGAPVKSGIRGRIVAGPACPTVTVPPKPQCVPRALVARLQVTHAGGGPGARTVRSDANGRFVIQLSPGRYVVLGLSKPRSAYPRPPPAVTVRVLSGRFTRITVTYDTGIR